MVEVKYVTKEPNLKEIERKSYMSYHQDGLLDIFASVYVLGFGLGIIMDAFWDFSFGIMMPAILVAVVLPLWIVAKRKITMPRIGFVNFGTGSVNKLLGIYVGLLVAGLGVFFAFIVFQSGQSPWLDVIFQNGLLVLGIGSLAVCSLFAYTTGLRRLYAYGLLALIAFAVGHVVGIFFAYILLTLGATVMVTGFALLVRFVRKYPVQGEKAIAD